MLLLRVYEQWRSISILGDHFRPVARGGKLCVLILFSLGSALVGICRFSRCVVDDFYLSNCLEGVIVCHKVTDALAEITDLDADIPQ